MGRVAARDTPRCADANMDEESRPIPRNRLRVAIRDTSRPAATLRVWSPPLVIDERR